ncbi:MAG: recombinase family protein [Planctomycetes bacterium]|nr:recombinase family protein [Planctomycetota bacterium]
MKAIGYLRVSSAKQAADGKDGFPRQRTAIRTYCAAQRVDLLEEHEDPGVSGTVPLEGRDGLSAALQRCAETDADMLLIERADRLGRDLIVSEMAVRAFADAGVSIVTADTGENLTEADSDPSRKLIRQVLNAVAEYERSALVAKLAAARARKKRSGGHSVGNYRFGSHPERPDEAATLDRIRQLRRATRCKKRPSLAAIAAILNEEGHSSRSGRRWTASMVRDVSQARA